MCYSGLCKYENHMGDCRHSFKLTAKGEAICPEGAMCGIEARLEELEEEAYDMDWECPKCSGSMNVKSTWVGVTHRPGVVSVELYCENCGCMIEEELTE